MALQLLRTLHPSPSLCLKGFLLQLGVMVHTWNPSTERLRQKDFKTIVKPSTQEDYLVWKTRGQFTYIL
ncbi:hypothetical protein I79_007539 [Cricetulus griseus]|uniref:Uncharacterized protein n=1 Tax=Cricetulus griseus TaxID=10029 RepID=G3HAT1_CRIGR|nr:hypothetical protein I79_007539 [Cricetulus griseus]